MWKLTVGIDHFWLNEEEKNTLLQGMSGGKEFVVLKSGLMIATRAIQTLVPREVIETTENLDDGKFECEYGKWHNEVCICISKQIE